MNRQSILPFVGAIVSLIGLVWLLQGIGVLEGSFMTGSQFWAIIGAVTFLAGAVMVAISFDYRLKGNRVRG